MFSDAHPSLIFDFIYSLNLFSGSGTCSEYSNQHENPSAVGLCRPSDLPHDVRTRLCQQRLLICLPVPSRRGGPIEGNPLCPFHSLTCLAHDLTRKTLTQLCDFIGMHVLGVMNEWMVTFIDWRGNNCVFVLFMCGVCV